MSALARRAPAVLLAGMVLGLGVELAAPRPQVDDAYISYRYAANWLAGEGLVFNPGDRVEGITNLLWTLGVGALGALGVEAPAAGHALGVLSALACLVLAAGLARALAPQAAPGWALLAPLALWASAPFARWATGGLETCAFAAWLCAAFWAAARGRSRLAAGLFFAATATRPEGALAAGIWLALETLRGRRPWGAAAVYAALCLVLTIGRLLYYGDPVPHTFTAKVAGWLPDRGALYLAHFLAGGALALLPAFVFACWRLPAARAAGGFAFAHMLYVLAIGGEALGHHRFLVPLLPLLAAGAAAGVGSATRPRSRAALAASLLLAAFWLAWLSPGHGFEPGKRQRIFNQADRSGGLFESLGRMRADVLHARGERDALIATGAIGALGYYTGAPIIDILGLVDREVASEPPSPGAVPGHSRSHPESVLARAPDYLVIPRKGQSRGALGAVRDLWAHPGLERDYRWDDELRAYRRVAPAASPGPAGASLVLVVVDTLRADRLGCYGAERDTTPALDALAEQGVRFANAIAPAPWTTPSVASLLTGLWPSRHGADTVRATLADGIPTLAERLRAAGYRTAAVVSHTAVGAEVGLDRGFEHFDQTEARGHDHVSGPAVTRRAIEWLDTRASGEPFFLLVHYFDPHYQYRRHAGIGWAAERAGRLAGHERVARLRRLEPPPSGEEVALLRDLYDEEVRFTDDAIGALFAALGERDLWEGSVVVLTADHGEEFFEHGWLGHARHQYEEVLRVPWLLRAPGVAPRVVPEPVSTTSLTPTLLDLLGVAHDARHDAPSLLPALLGDGVPERGIRSEVDFGAPLDRRKTARGKTLRRGAWKLIRDDLAETVELYDLESDPAERSNLADREPERVAALLAELERGDSAAGRPAGTERELSEAEIERLRALGYGD